MALILIRPLSIVKHGSDLELSMAKHGKDLNFSLANGQTGHQPGFVLGQTWRRHWKWRAERVSSSSFLLFFSKTFSVLFLFCFGRICKTSKQEREFDVKTSTRRKKKGETGPIYGLCL